ncbi:bifunctional diaminohydroxyphosphoribosylaminopyrimidine deaminase/5-amino-6-(5-phosphoribosylamino)uracil reductase RibD [Oceaniserpentilla sp. 4NH20-0058]|uniref:bifunctional diaminohydroxyphosphoribosylaminopyrimidine deaminase/5-amino-6-(5-phosphoribosylamino)uracil reductase RibD n=1 Tax=Oceaniserpentilla sp. 4NH20-0058 TaxID=3127660 RepID=UPI003105FEA6
MSHHQYMARAIALAKRGLYTADPNPRVGCVIVKSGQIIGEGYHRKAGEGHAEVNALAMAGEKAKDATAYVTLEPCSHFGRTPPCSEGLIAAGVRHVVCAMKDPNPQVSGRGFAKLKSAGIDVTVGILEEQARELNPGFIKRMEAGMPFVRLKMATSLDGRTAMQSGESQWITGPQARQDVQRLRARSSAIVTGIGSIKLDDSSLTVRADELGLDDEWAKEAAAQQPIRVVLDSQGQISADAKILKQSGETLLAVTKGVELEAGIEAIQLDQAANGLDLTQLLKILAEKQCNEVLVETGATLAGEFVRQGLVDEMVLYMAPCFMGSDARPLLQWPMTQMAEKQNLKIIENRMVGNDIRLTLVFEEQSN